CCRHRFSLLLPATALLPSSSLLPPAALLYQPEPPLNPPDALSPLLPSFSADPNKQSHKGYHW
ncbi:hypothetical protein TorRG33x02_243960, partial [Trema orientale]